MAETQRKEPDDTKAAQPLRIAVFISGDGSNLQALIDACAAQRLPGIEIVLVISNKAQAYGLQRALKHKIAAIFLPWQQREIAEARVLGLIKLFEIDLIVLAGWLRILSADFISHFPGRIINLHPALLPDDGGATYTTSDGYTIPALRGLHVVQKALDARLPVTGSTIHYVIPEVDAGPVISRVEVAIQPGDTAEVLQERIKSQEHIMIEQAIKEYQKERERSKVAPLP